MMSKLNEVGGNRPLFVKIYDELYHLIMNGVYPEGTLLPSEAMLVETLQVSRVTVRQALALLQEDGLTKSIKGKGTIVCGFAQQLPQGIEKISNPIQACYRIQPDDVEIKSRISLATGYLKARFYDKSVAVMTLERLYKYEQKLMVYSLSHIPVEVGDKLKLDLSNQNEVVTFLEGDAYATARCVSVDLKMTDTIDFVTKHEEYSSNEKALLYTEDLYFGDDYPYIYNKHYFISTDYKIHINAKA